MKHRKREGIHMKTAPQKSKNEPDSDDEGSKEEGPSVSDVWLPETNTAFRILMSVNLCYALTSYISDCDETYNYWEPLHHLMYGKGMQTWEYSPLYAIRSWAYIYLHYVLTWAQFGLLNSNKVFIFYFIKICFAIVCTMCEVQFYEGVAIRFGNHVARLVLLFLAAGSGMYIAATAFLPSSFCMFTTLFVFGQWMLGNLTAAVIGVAVGAILGWPFSVALGIPLAVDIVLRRQKYFLFAKCVGIALLTVLLPSFLMDSYYYGKPVVACLNILLYNVFTEHGPDLYGTEPLSYYLLNGMLNFNLVFVCALLSIIIVPVCEGLIHLKFTGYRSPKLLLSFFLSPMYIWVLIFFSQPHKEERFLFPIYPLICLNAAVSLATLLKVCYVYKLHNYINLKWASIAFLSVFVVISVSRSVALFQGYHSSIDLYPQLLRVAKHNHQGGEEVRVCVGKEWHRFPSSFFLPHNFTLHFVKSDFRGQLPQHFMASGLEGTQVIPKHFNDGNLEEKSRYVPIQSCQYLIDFDDGSSSTLEPRYSQQKQWKVLYQARFLSKAKSTSSLYRAFYIPLLFESRNVFGKYQLLQAVTSS